jgi:hypothetical protein
MSYINQQFKYTGPTRSIFIYYSFKYNAHVILAVGSCSEQADYLQYYHISGMTEPK